MKSLASITLDIKGRPWTFKLFTDKVYNKAYCTDDEESLATTLEDKYEVHFRKTGWSPITIKHELGHVLHFSSLVGSTSLTADDSIELMCDIIGAHCEEISFWSNRITERFLIHG